METYIGPIGLRKIVAGVAIVLGAVVCLLAFSALIDKPVMSEHYADPLIELFTGLGILALLFLSYKWK